MKPKTSKRKPDLQNMSLDGFFENMDADLGDDNSGDTDKEASAVAPPKKKKLRLQKPEKLVKKKHNGVEKKPVKKGKKKQQKTEADSMNVDSDTEEMVSAKEGGQKDVEKEHKQALKKLKDTDPELYSFLKQNDKKLLKFGSMAQSDEDATEDDDSGADDDGEDAVHKLPDKLEVASDESDLDDDNDEEEADDEVDATLEASAQKKITLKLLKKWTEELTTSPVKLETIRTVCKAFNSVLVTVTGDKSAIPAFRADGSAIFNGVVQLCVLHLGNAVKQYLNVNNTKDFKNIKKNKKFSKVQSCLRTYLTDLTNLLENVSSNHIMNVLLKHLHQFSTILICYPSITKPILKRLIVIWSTSEEESIRVLAFLCILKITCAQLRRFLSDVLKNMYLAYVKNSKFVSPNTLPGINFMRRSLTEMFTLDLTVSYQHVFLYIRQLAIHLRNAVILQKKDSFTYIYNWQYINSLKLWGDVLAATYDKKELEPLIYPYVSITTGVIKLIPSAQYFPLRFHCCRMLIELSARTRVFIPVLPFVVEVLNSSSFNEDHKKLSMKPVNLTCLLRFAPANIQENAYKDAVLELIYELSLEYLAHESSSLCFPDLVVPIVTILRKFCKTTKVYKYSRKIKQLTDKITENIKLIETARKRMPVKLNDVSAIRSWEATRLAEGTPLWSFWQDFAKENEKAKRRQATQSENISDYNLPTVKKIDKKPVSVQDGPAELFPSDDDEEDDSGNGPELDSMEEYEVTEERKKQKKLPKTKKGQKPTGQVDKKQKKKKSKKTDSSEQEADFPLENTEANEAVDILKDLTLDDWE
ncbi:nucleolar complex protein 2 homolog [Sabethes cyaneus]|uniref:nucleolar complex protein 2 homolog n=1 Tax=Sabethes cyaneus TaxID=53552 RepID=UPI00237EE4CF|nr:nucleolar complex protein 2 homolog [Sabethes cyaneus]